MKGMPLKAFEKYLHYSKFMIVSSINDRISGKQSICATIQRIQVFILSVTYSRRRRIHLSRLECEIPVTYSSSVNS